MRQQGEKRGAQRAPTAAAAMMLATAACLAVLCLATARCHTLPGMEVLTAGPWHGTALAPATVHRLDSLSAPVGGGPAPPHQLRLPAEPQRPKARGETLVVYVYGGSDPGGL